MSIESTLQEIKGRAEKANSNIWDCDDTLTFLSEYARPDVLRLVAALERAIAECDALYKTSKLIEESILAAEAEGLNEAIDNTTDYRLKSLITRRILWHRPELQVAVTNAESSEIQAILEGKQ